MTFWVASLWFVDHCHASSLFECHYFLCIVDDYSHVIWVFLSKDKAKNFEKLVYFCAIAKTQFGLLVQWVRSDHGIEFTDKRYKIYIWKMVSFMKLLALIRHNKMGVWNGKIDIYLMWQEPLDSKHLFQFVFGLMCFDYCLSYQPNTHKISWAQDPLWDFV